MVVLLIKFLKGNNMNTNYPTYSTFRQIGYRTYVYDVPNYIDVTIIRMDGTFITKFNDPQDLIHNRDYFEQWCSDHYFNIEKVVEENRHMTIWVS